MFHPRDNATRIQLCKCCMLAYLSCCSIYLHSALIQPKSCQRFFSARPAPPPLVIRKARSENTGTQQTAKHDPVLRFACWLACEVCNSCIPALWSKIATCTNNMCPAQRQACTGLLTGFSLAWPRANSFGLQGCDSLKICADVIICLLMASGKTQ